jgi:hypothetical protein
MNALLMGHSVPVKTTTTAFFSLKSARETRSPLVSLKEKSPDFLPTFAEGLSALLKKVRGPHQTASKPMPIRSVPKQFLMRVSSFSQLPGKGVGPPSTYPLTGLWVSVTPIITEPKRMAKENRKI